MLCGNEKLKRTFVLNMKMLWSPMVAPVLWISSSWSSSRTFATYNKQLALFFRVILMFTSSSMIRTSTKQSLDLLCIHELLKAPFSGLSWSPLKGLIDELSMSPLFTSLTIVSIFLLSFPCLFCSTRIFNSLIVRFSSLMYSIASPTMDALSDLIMRQNCKGLEYICTENISDRKKKKKLWFGSTNCLLNSLWVYRLREFSFSRLRKGNWYCESNICYCENIHGI